MTILCANGCHVYRVGSPFDGAQGVLRCQCGQAANGYPQVAMMFFPGYSPYTRPPKPDPAPETSLSQLRAARDDVKATHLSPDGRFAYTVRYGEVLQAEWDGAKYDSWWPVVGGKMPENAVKL